MVERDRRDPVNDIGARLRSLTLRSRALEVKKTYYPWNLHRITVSRLEKDAAAPGGAQKIRMACWRRGIDVSSRSWSKTCIKRLMKWKKDYKQTGLPKEPSSYMELKSESEGSADIELAHAPPMYPKLAPWALKNIGESKLREIGTKYGKEALQGMCHKRKILVSDNSPASLCISRLLEWKDKGHKISTPPSETYEEMRIDDWEKLSPERKNDIAEIFSDAHQKALEAWIWLNLTLNGRSNDFQGHMKALWGHFGTNMETDHVFPKASQKIEHPRNYQLLSGKINRLKSSHEPILFATLNGVDVMEQVIKACEMSSYKIPEQFDCARKYAEYLADKGHKNLKEKIFDPIGALLGEKVEVPRIDITEPLIKVPTVREILDAWQNISRSSMETYDADEWLDHGKMTEEEFLRDYSILTHRNHDSRYFQVVRLIPLENGGVDHVDNYICVAKHACFSTHKKDTVFVQERKFTLRTDIGMKDINRGACTMLAALVGDKRTDDACHICLETIKKIDSPWWFQKKRGLRSRSSTYSLPIRESGEILMKAFYSSAQ